MNTQALEMIVRDFIFIPFDGVILSDGFEDGLLSNAWTVVGSGVRETNGCLAVTPDAAGHLSGCATADPVHWNERGERYVFSMLVKTVAVSLARSGDDLGLVGTLSSGTNEAVAAANAAQLLGQYDEEAGRFALSFYTKTNQPGAAGMLRYAGVLTNAAHWFATGGVEFRMELGGREYAVSCRNARGEVLPLSGATGQSTGLHGLVETVSYGYWLVGASNLPSGAQGTLYVDRAAVGLASQAEPVPMACSVAGPQTLCFAAPAYFDTRYTLECTTNLLRPFAAVTDCFERAGGQVIITQPVTSVEAYYRLRLE